MEQLTDIAIPVITLACVVLVLWAMHWLLLGRKRELGNEARFPRQIILLGFSIAGLLAMVFSLPIEASSRNQLIGLIGLLISGLIAFSSTTVVSNLMAGILLRITKPFRTGDFIRVGEHFGRVSERGLFDTEIQTESRELISLPNTLLITQAVNTVRSSGTIISATLSLGYDVHHGEAEALLKQAAEKCELEDPFVHILELGNFSVTYRVSGVLTEVKRLITARSHLYQKILDTLHEQQIEIMSPSIMNQRRIADDAKVLPEKTSQARHKAEKPKDDNIAENIAFDKAEAAEAAEKTRQEISDEIKALEARLGDADKDQKSDLKAQIDQLKQKLKSIDEAAKTDQGITEKTPVPDADTEASASS